MNWIWPIIFAVALLAVAIWMIWKQKRKTPLSEKPIPIEPIPVPDTVPDEPEPDINTIPEPAIKTTADNTKVKTDNTNLKS